MLTASLPAAVDPASISLRAKIPYKVICFREALMWRTEELARSACDLYERGDIACAAILTRALFENVAMLSSFKSLIEAQITKTIDTEQLDKKILRFMFGQGKWDDLPKRMHVMDMIRKVDEEFDGILAAYELLSEFTHVNWAGTTGLYSRVDRIRIRTEFGRGIGLTSAPTILVLNSLSISVATFQLLYNEMSDLMPEFVVACERALSSKGGSQNQG